MPKQRFDVEVPVGYHLGYSRGTDGARRAHLFRDDTNELAGHAELFPVDEDEGFPAPGVRYPLEPYPSEAFQRLPASYRLAEDVVNAFFEWLTPHAEAAVVRAADAFRAWCLKTAVPACKSAAHTGGIKLTDRHKSDPQAETPLAVAEPRPAGGAVISSHEAQVRVVAAALARAFSDEQLRMVLNAQIAQGDDLVPGEKALDRLATEELEQRAQLLFESNPALLEEFLEAFCGGGGVSRQRALSAEGAGQAGAPAGGWVDARGVTPGRSALGRSGSAPRRH